MSYARYIDALEEDLSCVGLRGAGELIDQRRLAGPVGADQRDQATFVHGEVDVIRDDERAEALRKSFDAQQGRAQRRGSRRFGRKRSRQPTPAEESDDDKKRDR